MAKTVKNGVYRPRFKSAYQAKSATLAVEISPDESTSANGASKGLVRANNATRECHHSIDVDARRERGCEVLTCLVSQCDRMSPLPPSCPGGNGGLRLDVDVEIGELCRFPLDGFTCQLDKARVFHVH
jgi:hypothetical protein